MMPGLDKRGRLEAVRDAVDARNTAISGIDDGELGGGDDGLF